MLCYASTQILITTTFRNTLHKYLQKHGSDIKDVLIILFWYVHIFYYNWKCLGRLEVICKAKYVDIWLCRNRRPSFPWICYRVYAEQPNVTSCFPFTSSSSKRNYYNLKKGREKHYTDFGFYTQPWDRPLPTKVS